MEPEEMLPVWNLAVHLASADPWRKTKGRGYEWEMSIESIRGGQGRKVQREQQREERYRAMERDRGRIYRQLQRRGTTVNSPKKSW